MEENNIDVKLAIKTGSVEGFIDDLEALCERYAGPFK